MTLSKLLVVELCVGLQPTGIASKAAVDCKHAFDVAMFADADWLR